LQLGGKAVKGFAVKVSALLHPAGNSGKSFAESIDNEICNVTIWNLPAINTGRNGYGYRAANILANCRWVISSFTPISHSGSSFCIVYQFFKLVVFYLPPRFSVSDYRYLLHVRNQKPNCHNPNNDMAFILFMQAFKGANKAAIVFGNNITIELRLCCRYGF
jgi:hypothetical protein